MRILFLGFDIEGYGGIATYSRHQVAALKRLGHAVETVSIDKQDGAPLAPGIADRKLPFENRLRAVATLVKEAIAARGRYDLVMLNHVFLAGLGWLVKKTSGTPFTVNVYNIDILTKLPALREAAFAAADLVIADCQYTIDWMPKYRNFVPPTGLLYDPVDVAFFKPMAKDAARAELAKAYGWNDLAGRFLVTTVAAMLLPPNKGQRQTIDAIAKLKDPRILYVIVGSGPDREAMEAHAAAAGIAAQVRFTGRAPQAQLPLLYAAADVATLVARGGPGWGEAVPLGLIEAAACGTAFLCGNEDGSPEAIDDADPCGFALGPLDVDAIAGRLAALRDDPALCTRMGAAGIRTVGKLFAFDRYVEQQERLLKRFVDRAKLAA
ncbi:MAG: glycosyltransferase family 4 protein [Proteobacteria bacterium]|nr:glycosyltransferase family 4 protein [Pseudomonadota bacterium]